MELCSPSPNLARASYGFQPVHFLLSQKIIHRHLTDSTMMQLLSFAKPDVGGMNPVKKIFELKLLIDFFDILIKTCKFYSVNLTVRFVKYLISKYLLLQRKYWLNDWCK